MNIMQLQLKIMICDAEGRFMGQGPYRLLLLTGKLGSLRRAAAEMGMSYSKAHAIIKRLENCLQRQVVHTHAGGLSGGGAELTEFGNLLLDAYGKLEQRINAESAAAFTDFCANLKNIPADG